MMHLSVVIYNIIMSFLLLHWNARSLIANGQEFKKYVEDMSKSPDIICIQETWLCKSLDFKLNGYEVIRKDRNNGRDGGSATFIKENVIHRQGRTGSKKRPWIFSQIGPPQLQYKQSPYLTILQQSCRIYGK